MDPNEWGWPNSTISKSPWPSDAQLEANRQAIRRAEELEKESAWDPEPATDCCDREPRLTPIPTIAALVDEETDRLRGLLCELAGQLSLVSSTKVPETAEDAVPSPDVVSEHGVWLKDHLAALRLSRIHVKEILDTLEI